MAIQDIVKSVFRRFGIDVVRYVPTCERPFPVLPMLIRDYVGRKTSRPFRFVQVGASDGLTTDPLHELVVELKLTGILIEPLPDKFEELKRNYEFQSQLRFENIAVARNGGRQTIYRVKTDTGAPVGLQGSASFDPQHVLRQVSRAGLGEPTRHIAQVEVPTLTLEQVLARHQFTHVDLLQIDTEGFDFEVVKLAIESGIYPDIINYEYVHLPPKARLECRLLLAAHNYSFMDVGMDTLAVRTPILD